MFKNIQHILEILKVTKINYYYSIIIILLGVIVETISIGIFIPVITALISIESLSKFRFFKNFDLFNSLSHQEIIFFTVLALIIIFTARATYLFFLNYYKAHIQWVINVKITEKLLKLRLNQSFIQFYEQKSSNILNLITKEVGNYASIVLVFFSLISELCIFLSLSTFILIYQPFVSLFIVAIIVLLGSIFFQLTKGYTERQGKIRLENSRKQLNILNDAIGSFVNIKLYKLQSFFLSLFSKPNYLFNTSIKKIKILKSIPKIWFEFLIVLSMSITILILHKNNTEGENILVILGVFAAAAYRILPSITKILSSLQSLKYNVATVENILSILSDQNKNNDKFIKNNDELSFNKILELKNLYFSYKNKSIFSNLSLEIKKNEFVGITGETGSGKSTFLHIFSGLIECQSGEIFADKVNIQNNLDKWSSKIAYLPQKSFYLDDTIRNNIIFGNEKKKFDENFFKKIIKNCELENLLKNLEYGDQTQIGENGSKLSGGQLQRIGLARCLYREPEILLLDESTSALDEEIENKILSNISKLNLTLVFVTHRKEALSFCHKVYSLRNKTLIEI